MMRLTISVTLGLVFGQKSQIGTFARNLTLLTMLQKSNKSNHN